MQLVEQAGGAAAFFQSNIAVERDVKALIDAVISSFGRLDYAFNNAGIEQNPQPLPDQTHSIAGFARPCANEGLLVAAYCRYLGARRPEECTSRAASFIIRHAGMHTGGHAGDPGKALPVLSRLCGAFIRRFGNCQAASSARRTS